HVGASFEGHQTESFCRHPPTHGPVRPRHPTNHALSARPHERGSTRDLALQRSPVRPWCRTDGCWHRLGTLSWPLWPQARPGDNRFAISERVHNGQAEAFVVARKNKGPGRLIERIGEFRPKETRGITR